MKTCMVAKVELLAFLNFPLFSLHCSILRDSNSKILHLFGTRTFHIKNHYQQSWHCPQKIAKNILCRKNFREYFLEEDFSSLFDNHNNGNQCSGRCFHWFLVWHLPGRFLYCFDKTKQTKWHGLDNAEYSYRSAPRSLLEVLLTQHLRLHRLLERRCRHL